MTTEQDNKTTNTDEAQLAEEFTLRDKDSVIDFSAADDEIREIDVRETEDGLPKVFKMKSAEQRYFKEYFNNLPSENRVRVCKDTMFHKLNKMNGIDAEDLKAYLERIRDSASTAFSTTILTSSSERRKESSSAQKPRENI